MIILTSEHTVQFQRGPCGKHTFDPDAEATYVFRSHASGRTNHHLLFAKRNSKDSTRILTKLPFPMDT